MISPADSLVEALSSFFEDEYDHVVVYADADGESVLHEGPATVRANGWIELPEGRLLSPDAVHHVDTYPDR